MNEQKIKTIDVHLLKELKQNNPRLCLIDVREHHEWLSSRIPGALHIPKDEIPHCISQTIPDKTQPIYLHCKSGVRSLYAASCLLEMGYEEVYSVDGGIIDWAACGYPVEQ
ncbi:rhodanese-like domain-containing protein [Legionella israelensis]|uniref:Rhodanese-like domain-containing protein n=1 Tax=Legionella israelensis TaxID=454 RepID=A0AAX1EFU9_9GAMM|nr:rhodanese-like domain-containing protein [Legionella israelensis]QBR83694.1 rhodanese-like domain-containing protein [Legionella israelensis]